MHKELRPSLVVVYPNHSDCANRSTAWLKNEVSRLRSDVTPSCMHNDSIYIECQVCLLLIVLVSLYYNLCTRYKVERL